MNRSVVELLDVDDIRVADPDALAAVSTAPGVHPAPAHPVAVDPGSPHRPPSLCGPVHTHAVGKLPAGPPDLAIGTG